MTKISRDFIKLADFEYGLTYPQTQQSITVGVEFKVDGNEANL